VSERLSVAVPVYNEEQVLPELLRRLAAVLDAVPGGPHEVIFVDDGSADRSLALLEEAAARDPRIRVVSLSRNFGHQAAICAGLDHATGDLVVVMDADLQDIPEAIPQFLAKRAEGFDVVYARRVRRKEGPLLRLSYWLFYRLMAALSDVRVPLDAGDFSLMTRPVVDAIRSTPERQRYVRGLRAWVGFRQMGIEVERAARQAGETKYDATGLLGLALSGLFSFSVVPLRAAVLVGALAVAASVLFAAYSVAVRFLLSQTVPGFTALIVAIVFLAGVQLLFLGVIGEYLGRVYAEAKGRPLYVVGRVIGPRS
jgi:polyisoprenyl-phosphate glycosyltransferase